MTEALGTLANLEANLDIYGLEKIRTDLGLSPEKFALALTEAAGKLVDKPLRDIELHEVAIIYYACAEVKSGIAIDDANFVRSFFGLDTIGDSEAA